MRRKFTLSALVALFLAAGFYASAFLPEKGSTSPPAEETSLGTEGENFNYKRIISLAPSITEVLFSLGAGGRVVGITRYGDFPPETADISKVGGYFDINYEAILATGPDLVILLAEHDEPGAYLSGLGIQVMSVDHSSIGGIIDSIKAIGKVLEVQDAAAELVAELEKRIERVLAATKGRSRPRVMVAIGRGMEKGSIGNVYISGRDGFYDELITLAGGENAYQDKTLKFPALSVEGVVRLNPEVIVEMLPDVKEAESVEQIAEKWRSISSVDAIEKERLYIFVEDFVVVPGPRFILLLEMMAKVLHPEIDWEAM
ncbi:MAG: ABC transporter substrate-binding protein [bacterium]